MRWLPLLALSLTVVACDESSSCEAPAPLCEADCCGAREPVCADGVWGCTGTICTCDAGMLPDAGAPVDGGISPFPADAGPVACGADLGPYQCLRQGCVPFFDDACCPACDPEGECADCTDVTVTRCVPAADACEDACDTPADWACAPMTPSCAGAAVTDVDSCDAPGCVPAYPAGEGAPDIGDAVCVPIHRDVCRTSCERVEPTCPDGTTPEGDGSCYTDRCVPAFVCA